ncbi:MAG: gamma-glutamyl-gamma-aminobutyrate hydrolase family protein, partial [Planctomycetales bacterium]|nr:gamma-glutamyl-gamma-aminobutyrate hydrolase family protein [Planctomycetales bacterium]
MFHKPLIGINVDYRDAKQDSPAVAYVTAGYFNAISKAGGIPVIVPPQDSEDDLNAILDQLQGFVLVGGQDLDPRNDGFMLHPSVRPMNERREAFDRMLVRLLSERRMP